MILDLLLVIRQHLSVFHKSDVRIPERYIERISEGTCARLGNYDIFITYACSTKTAPVRLGLRKGYISY